MPDSLGTSGPAKRAVWWTLVAIARGLSKPLAGLGLNTQEIVERLWPLRAAIQRLGCRGTVVRASGGLFLYDSDDLINLKLAMVGAHEFDTTHYLQTRLRPSDVFVDVGANLGYFSVLAGMRVNAGRVVAIEPSPRTLAALRTNIALNALQNVEAVQRLLWSEAGREMNLRVLDPYNLGANSLFGDGAVEVVLRTDTLDNLVSELGLSRVDIVKIDVEGAEREVLLGARHCLREFRPRAVILALDNRDESLRRQALDIVLQSGYHEVDPFTSSGKPARGALDRSLLFLERMG